MDKITVTQADRDARIDAIARDLVSAGNDETTIAVLRFKAKELTVGTPVQHIALPNVHGVIGNSVSERLCVSVTKPHMLDSAIYFADPRDLRLAQPAQMAASDGLAAELAAKLEKAEKVSDTAHIAINRYTVRAILASLSASNDSNAMRDALEDFTRIAALKIDPGMDALGVGEKDALGIVQHMAARSAKRLRAALANTPKTLEPVTVERDALRKERAMVMQDKEINNIIQTRLERGQWALDLEGFFRALKDKA